jgi:hypothetical protein
MSIDTTCNLQQHDLYPQAGFNFGEPPYLRETFTDALLGSGQLPNHAAPPTAGVPIDTYPYNTPCYNYGPYNNPQSSGCYSDFRRPPQCNSNKNGLSHAHGHNQSPIPGYVENRRDDSIHNFHGMASLHLDQSYGNDYVRDPLSFFAAQTEHQNFTR